MLGTLTSPVYAASIHQIPELDFEREEIFSQDLSNTNQIKCSELSQIESAIQIAPNLLSENADPGTCQARPNSVSGRCEITSSQCNAGYLPVPLGANCNCVCQRATNL